MLRFDSAADLTALCEKESKTIADLVIEVESADTDESREAILDLMRSRLQIMAESIAKGRALRKRSHSGLSGGDAAKLAAASGTRAPLLGELAHKTMGDALAVAELNASLGKIVAAPTAGSSGVLPAVMLNLTEHLQQSEDDLVRAAFTASGIGILIAKHATLSGAEGGCQAECGAASAMAAAAAADLMGADAKTILNAAALALKNSLGLTCDPVAGLVEVPCAKRNAFHAVHALVAAEMAMAGIESVIPFDEVVSAMRETGRLMSDRLRESALAGLARTPTAVAIAEELARG